MARLRNFFEALGHRWQLLTLALLTTIGIALGLSGAGRPFDNLISEIDGRLRHRDASGELHIVEIDARSIAAVDRWPWPRSNYAALVDRLNAAGAASITFDVDFSSHSTTAEDMAFARALAQSSGRVVLPTFGQRAGGGRKGWTDSLPIPILREHASLAAVSILPDADGYVRRVPIGTITDGTARPSLSATIAGVNGAAGADFPIDLAIDRATIPRHSFIDVRDGRTDLRALAGKHVLIGATAIELGDRYAVPNHGVIPGVVIQAMAAETLRGGIPRESGWQLPLVAALALAAFILNLRKGVALAIAAFDAPILLAIMAMAINGAFAWRFELAPAMLVLVSAGAVAAIRRGLCAARHQQLHDTETGLPNRTALLITARATEAVGIVAARIADFDKLTTGLGDKAAADLVVRLRERIALIEGTEAIYRIDDRVLAWQVFEADGIEERLSTMRTVMLNAVEVAGRRVNVSLYVGVALETGEAVSDRTLSRAMLAAGTAQTDGVSWHFYSAQQDEAVDRELSLLGELDDAIAGGEIDVVYQPKLCLETNAIVSVEALVRWHHANRGTLRPDLFVPLAERNDRIAGLTLYVLRRTITDLLAWHEGGRTITGAVNLSATLLNSEAFLDELRQIIGSSGISPALLTFEVTESATMADTAEAAAALQSFRDLGIGISIDDYGTGQSTLSYLKQLPLNELKIDRSFVQFAHANRGDGVLVRSTVDLAHDLGLKIVAEGVEDEECLAFLRSIGCDLAQGYLISKPVGASEITALLSQPIAFAA